MLRGITQTDQEGTRVCQIAVFMTDADIKHHREVLKEEVTELLSAMKKFEKSLIVEKSSSQHNAKQEKINVHCE